MKNYRSVIITLLALLFCQIPAFAQGGRTDNVVFRGGVGIAGVNVAVCQPLATTAASVTANLATFTMISNPQTAGFAPGMPLLVAGFTGGDTYFNAGSISSGFQITGGYTILSVTPTQVIVQLTHANAAAASNGTLLQMGNSTTSCAGKSVLYTDSTLGTPSGVNPVITDGFGNFGFWATPGQYYTQFYGPTVTTTLRFVSVACVPGSAVGCAGSISGTAGTNQVVYGVAPNTLGSDASNTYIPGGGPQAYSATTPATNVANFNAPSITQVSNYWNGAASSLDTWTLGVVLAAGANPSSKYVVSNPRANSIYSVTADQLQLFGSSGNPLLCLNGILSQRGCFTVSSNAGATKAWQLWTVNPVCNMCATVASGNPETLQWNVCPIMFPTSVIDRIGLSSAVGTTIMGSSTVFGGTGLFEIEWNAKVTTAAGVSSTLGPLTITYTHLDGTMQTVTCAAFSTAGAVETSDAGNTTSTALYGIPCSFYALNATNISYAFGYASNAANAMIYNLSLRLERLQN